MRSVLQVGLDTSLDLAVFSVPGQLVLFLALGEKQSRVSDSWPKHEDFAE